MHSICYINVLLYTLLLYSNSVSCDLSYENQMFNFVTSGLAQIFWENVRDANRLVSSHCAQSIDETLAAFELGHVWAYELLDASAKLSSGLLDGTVTSFGDYDQCLGVRREQNEQFSGAYCMIRLEMAPNSSSSNRSSSLRKAMKILPMFDYFYPSQGLCVLSACSASELRILVSEALREYSAINVQGHFSCDTVKSVSYANRLQNLAASQKIAMIFLGIIFVLVLVSTARELYCNFVHEKSPRGRIQAFSTVSNTRELFSAPSRASGYYYVVELNKLIMIFFGIGGHSIVCLETIRGWYIVHRLRYVRLLFSVWWVNGFLNENGLGMVAVTGGFVSYWTVSPIIRRGQFKYSTALLDRWLKFVPVVMSLVALELVWPLVSSGPLYTPVANHLLEKCSSNAWMNFLFINNLKTAPENCAPHLFYSSIDLQLFIIALVVIYTMVKYPKMGILLAIFMVISGNVTLATLVHLRGSSPVLVDAHGTVDMTIKYLDFAHFATYGQMSNYFCGILLAFVFKETTIPFDIHPVLKWSMYMYGNIVFTFVHFAPALHNTFKVITPNLVPFYMIGIKLVYTTAQSSMLMFFFPYLLRNKNSNGSKGLKNTNIKYKKSRYERLNIWAGKFFYNFGDALMRSTVMIVITKLALAVYVINYYLIRLDFFTSRVPYGLTIYTISKRFFYVVAISIIGAFFFHIFFIAPIEKLRKTLKLSQSIQAPLARPCDSN